MLFTTTRSQISEETVVSAIATVIVGFVAGVVALVLSILTKDQKTSEFRQNWIDGLRNDVAQLVAHMAVLDALSDSIKAQADAERRDYALSLRKEFEEAAMLQSRIKLRLNPHEHKVLIGLVNDTDGIGQSSDLMQKRIEEITNASQVILKEEWERVKRGEPSFVWLKTISQIASIFALFGLSAAFIAVMLDHFGISREWW